MKDLKLYICLAAAVFIAYLVALYNQPKPVDWRPTYLKSDKIPYGTFILHSRLHDIFPNTAVVPVRLPAYNVVADSAALKGSYLIIAGSTGIDRYDYQALVRYMQQGNRVFIAAFYLSKFLNDTLKIHINTEARTARPVAVNFTNPLLKRAGGYIFGKEIGTQYFSELDSSRATVLGINEKGHANFVRYNFGKGALYIMAGPQYFTNYNMLDPAGAEYAAKALSYLQPGGKLIWDEHETRGNEDEDASPMRVFFKHGSLRWAYYIAIAGLLLFVLYGIKRRQRMIPVADPLRNTTVEFVHVVGQLYYQQRNNRNIAEKKIIYLLEYIRTRYQLKTGVLDAEFTEALAGRAGITTALAHELLEHIGYIRSGGQVNDKDLIRLNRNMEQFYKQAM